MASQDSESNVNVVLFGVTGAGKSASGNTILGEDIFPSSLSPSSVTIECQVEKREFEGKTLAFIDTPGFFHTSLTGEKFSRPFMRFLMDSSPGPYVFLLVVKLNQFLENDKKMVELYQEMFKKAKNHTIVLFTHGDEGKDPAKFIEAEECATLKKFIQKNEIPYHVFDNKKEGKDKDDPQVISLLNEIISVAEKGQFGKAMEEVAAKLKERKESKKIKWEDVKETFTACDDLFKKVIPQYENARAVIDFMTKMEIKLVNHFA